MKKILSLLFGVGLASFALFSGCYYDNEEELYGNTTVVCDTAGIKYAAIATILTNNNCMGCHSEAAADVSGGGYHLEGYDNLKAVASNNNNLYRSVAQDGTVSPMPKGGAKIADCDISKIDRWVKNGYPQ
jgi:hypothetical protein